MFQIFPEAIYAANDKMTIKIIGCMHHDIFNQSNLSANVQIFYMANGLQTKQK